MARIALVTGIAGQDGSYLSEFLQSKGYQVYGVDRPGRGAASGACEKVYGMEFGRDGDLQGILDEVRPDEVYHLAGASRVSASFDDPLEFARSNGLGAVQILEAIRRHRDRRGRDVRLYQASSSEMFGSTGLEPHNERTPFRPQSPYACAKAYAHLQAVVHREAFGLHVCCGILFNHESPRRSEHFVTRKITAAAARIKLGLADRIVLGNVDVRRDWGFAGDYVEAMWLMLQQDRPDDYVVATGQTHTVREFGEEVFGHLGLDWARYAVSDPKLYRPADLECVCGDASKARRVLGWQPRVSFVELAHMMADYDWDLVCRSQTAP